MLIINKEEVKKLISMNECIEIMEQAFKDMGKGNVVQPVRSAVTLEDENVFGVMPVYMKKDYVVGAKLITVFDENHTLGLPSHQGMVALFDAQNGTLKGIIDGTMITALRTAAVSAVATKLLSKEDATTLSIIGTGTQAKAHIEALCNVRPIETIKVWGRDQEKLAEFCTEMSEIVEKEIIGFATIEEAVHNSDIICTVTSAKTPILQEEWVSHGAHINAVGACKAKDRELDSELVKNAYLYVDNREAASKEAGDYLLPLQEGLITEDHIRGELSELVNHEKQIRQNETTIFKSLGLAFEDIATANSIFQKAFALKRGITVDF